MKHLSLLLIMFILLDGITAQNSKVYNIDWDDEKYIVAGTSAMLASSYFIDRSIDLITESEVNALVRNEVVGFDRSAINNYSESAAHISDVFRDGIVFVPFTLLLSSKARNEVGAIGLMYLETFAITSAITTTVKGLPERVRPFVYNPNVPLEDKLNKNARKSFYSGHTSHVASLSFFTASVFSDLYPDSDYKYLVWAGAIAAPAITAYCRYKAGKHFPTDVMVGYGVGAAIGYLVPKLHLYNSKSQRVDFSFQGSGIGLTIALN